MPRFVSFAHARDRALRSFARTRDRAAISLAHGIARFDRPQQAASSRSARLVRFGSYALSAVLAASAASAAPRSLKTMPVSEIRPGMRGYGLSVFRGTEPERFDVEVIDVLENFRPDQDLVLIRTPHPLLDHAGSVAGMSGSPVYLDGRLIGAYAYGWPFGKDPIAGVTPIANMLRELDRPARRVFPALSPLPTTPALRAAQGYVGGERRDALHALRERAAQTKPQAGWTRVSTPLLVGGMSSAMVEVLREHLGPLGLAVLDAGGSARKKPAATPNAAYVDGGAIAITLLRGDIQATGVGTVTYVDGRRAVAFGHPMLDAGEVGLPAATARVIHVLASERSSFKMAEALAPLGTLVHDRQSAIVVDNDAAPRTIPVRITLSGLPGLPRNVWNVEAANHRLLTPGLLLSAIGSALGATVNDVSDVMFRAETTVNLHGYGEQRLVDVGYAPLGMVIGGAIGKLRLFDLLEAAYDNPFGPVDVASVDVKLDLRFAHDVVEIVAAQLTKDTLDPGEPARILVKLRPYGGEISQRIIELPLSETLAGEELEVELLPGDRVRLPQPVAQSFGDVLAIVRSGLPSTSLVVSVQRKGRGLSVASHVLQNLPRSALDALATVHDTSRQPSFITQERTVIPLGSVVTGHGRLALEVRKEKR